MRFKSKKVGGYQLFAVTGTNTVSFGIDFDPAQTAGLLGFAVEREDPKEKQRYFMYGFKVFESVYPNPDPSLKVSTFDQPVQSFVWDDFTTKPGRTYIYHFHPVKGSPKSLDRSAPVISITVETEKLYSARDHDVFFNRGVASSQAYAREFANQRPDKIADPALRAKAFQWLSRDLDEALFRFIDQAQKGDTLLGCFYEFRYEPAARKFADAIARGVKVSLILDAKQNGRTDSKGKVIAPFPRDDNMALVAKVLPKSAVARWREANPNAIAHNKFIVLLRGAAQTPEQVWTGSTNLSDGGVHGQTNVGHWIKDPAAAIHYRDYWNLLLGDPGAVAGQSKPVNSAAQSALRKQVADLLPTPTDFKAIATGTTPVFSPRPGSAVLDMYASMMDDSGALGCVTLAFGISKVFKDRLVKHLASGPLTFMLLEKKDEAKANSKTPFVPLGFKQNVYQAWGSFLDDPLYRWTRETNAGKLKLNSHVSYVHSKFLLRDPLGADPIVVTGSANFSDASTNDNDENMLLIRGNMRVADIYFTEFNRLFFHYYFRSVRESLSDSPPVGAAAVANAAADTKASLFLDETDGWLKKYKAGALRTKRVKMFAAMQGAAPG